MSALELDRIVMKARRRPRAVMVNRAFMRSYAKNLIEDWAAHSVMEHPAVRGPIETWRVRFSGIPLFLIPSRECDPPRAYRLARLL